MPRRRVVAAVSGALCLVTLTACSTLKVGAAATVGDDQLSQTDVTDVAEEVDAQLAAADRESVVPAEEVPLYVVASWVDATLVESLAATEDVSVSPGELDTFLADFDEETRSRLAAERALPSSQLERAAQAFLLQQKLAELLAPGASPEEQSAALQEAMTQTADELGVSINPRFGSWDPAVPGVVPRDAERLSSVDEPLPEPGGPLVPATP